MKNLLLELSGRERRVRVRKAKQLQRRHGCPRWTGASDEALDQWFAFLHKRVVGKVSE